MNIKGLSFGALCASVVISSKAATPDVFNVTMMQEEVSRIVTITYTLADAPAVITLDVQTNATGDVWASIGGEALWNAEGHVWKKVGGNLSNGQSFSGTITWCPEHSWPGHKIKAGGARAVVTAWALDNTPDYMVVDVSASAQPGTQAYYQSADFVPGGVTNDIYKTTTLLMRKIMAKNVRWTMGSTTLETKRDASREATHQVTLTNNYYAGVFPITQAQWELIQTSRPAPSYFNNVAVRAMRPVEQVSYNEIRNAANSTEANTVYDWPANPNPDSFLGKLRTKTGIDFDLPSEAQWEFAARAVNGDTKWGNGSAILNKENDENLNLLGRNMYNGGKVFNGTEYIDSEQSCDAENGTAIVGSYTPNAWGLYDTAGNVWEWCLDWYADDITAHDGKVNIDPLMPSRNLSGDVGADRVRKGGSLAGAAGPSRPAFRGNATPTARIYNMGFRVFAVAGLR